MEKRFLSITGLLVIAAIVLAINLLGALLLHRVKFDMTEERLYTLSEGSVNIVQSLDDDISAKLYYSKTAAAQVPMRTGVSVAARRNLSNRPPMPLLRWAVRT